MFGLECLSLERFWNVWIGMFGFAVDMFGLECLGLGCLNRNVWVWNVWIGMFGFGMFGSA